jgi:GAF domain-containing protein
MPDEPDTGRGYARQARTSEGEAIDAGVARDLSELARAMQAEPDTGAVMQRIVDAAVTEIGGATDAAITLLAHGRITSPAHTSQRATLVGQAQMHTGQGPCVDAARSEVTIRSDDLRRDDRWPEFGKVAGEQGVLAILSFQLFVEGDSMGALDVYSDTAHGFDPQAENAGLLLAAHAAIALKASRQGENLRIALDSRDIIGQAKGILMERYKIDTGHAFDLLVRSSQSTGRKLREVADELVTTGELPIAWQPPDAH